MADLRHISEMDEDELTELVMRKIKERSRAPVEAPVVVEPVTLRHEKAPISQAKRDQLAVAREKSKVSRQRKAAEKTEIAARVAVETVMARADPPPRKKGRKARVVESSSEDDEPPVARRSGLGPAF